MGKQTPGLTRNQIRRSLRELVDPSPTDKEKNEIRKFFNYECAYCGKRIKQSKEGHIDHLVSSALGGVNNISNRVLSCADCNEKEKLDMAWEKFLSQKNLNKDLLQKRKEKILQWQAQYGDQRKIEIKIIEIINHCGDEIIKIYNEKVENIRKLKNL